MADTMVWTRCKRCGKWERRPPSVPCGCGSQAKEPAAVSVAPPVEPAVRQVGLDEPMTRRLLVWLDAEREDETDPEKRRGLDEMVDALLLALEDSHGG